MALLPFPFDSLFSARFDISLDHAREIELVIFGTPWDGERVDASPRPMSVLLKGSSELGLQH